MELSDSKQVIVERHNKAVYVDGDRIVKVFKATKPASDVFNEALNLARVIEAGVRVPKILEVSQVADGSWALSTEYVEGVTMRSLMDAAEGTPEYDKLLEQFVDFQIEIQNTAAPELLKDQKTKIAGMVGKVKELDPSVRYDLQMRADRMAPGRAICHCDFNPSNVIVTEDGTLYACDWTHVTRGLPARPLLQEGRRCQAEGALLGARHGRRRALPRPQGLRGVPPRSGRRRSRHRLALVASHDSGPSASRLAGPSRAVREASGSLARPLGQLSQALQ